MFDSAKEILEKIRLGEDSRIELKQMIFAGDKVRGPKADDLAAELAAFANAKGGILILGVGDKSREILGIPGERLDLAESFVAAVVRDKVKPALYPSIERLELPGSDGRGRPVLKVTIERSLFVHESPGGYFYRVGSSKRRMDTEYLVRLVQQRSQSRLIRYDETVVLRATLEDLDVDRFRTVRTQDDRPDLMRKLGLAREDDAGVLRPTIAGVLVASRRPEDHLSHAFIQAVAYRGKTLSGAETGEHYQLDSRDITGPLDQQVERACHFVLKNMRVAASKDIGRHDLPQYDMTAVFEAVVNAVAHRDYSMSGSKIRLRLFSDRLELYSPGSLVNTMTVDSLPFRQAARNETVTSLLAKCRVPEGLSGLDTPRATLMDKRGEGVGWILERSRRLSGRSPVYELFDESELRLTIFAASLGSSRPAESTETS
jgi:predicted HTH transcriptional regulator